MARNISRDELLIEEIRKHDCLFDTFHESYKNKILKDNVLAKIGEMTENGYIMTGKNLLYKLVCDYELPFK